MSAPNIELPYNFKPRKYQEPFFIYMNEGGKRAVLVHHRRAGKDICSWNFLIYSAFEKKGIYYYIFPTYSQGKKVLWDGMTNSGDKFLSFIPKELIQGKPNATEMKIHLTNGSMIQIVGSDNYDSIMGTNPTGCILSEYSLQDPRAWSYIRPILDANDGWAIFVYTPRGNNHAKVLYDMAIKNPDWFCQVLTVEDTKVISKETLEKAKAEGMSEDMINQEYFCSFTTGILGAYYAKYMDEMAKEKRIGHIPVDPHLRVHTAWDLGVDDPSCIIFFQIYGKEIRIVDYFEQSGVGLDYYAKVLKEKNYLYGQHFAPQDINARELSTSLSRLALARNLGINFTVLKTTKVGKYEQIENVRGKLNRFWIDETKCKRLIDALTNYKRKFMEKMQCFAEQPDHDWSSHGSDATAYLCMAVNLLHDDKTFGVSNEEAEQMMHKYRPY